MALIITALTLAPAAVHAQDSGVLEVDSGTTTSTPAPAGVPSTGIAPENKVLENSSVFIAGSVLGAGAGLAVVTLRKKRTNY